VLPLLLPETHTVNLSLADFIMVTEPLMEPLVLKEILSATAGVQWRVPEASPDYPDRTCTTFPLSAAVGGNYPIDPEHLPMAKRADDILLEASIRALNIYKSRYKMVTRQDSGFDILRYDVGQYIGSHFDDMVPRVLSMSIALNDEYTGGEFRFWGDPDRTLRLPAGCALMFPPNFMYPHEILPVTSGVRYSMITWFL
jgi:predicted 2-oxoglutarate/Fe(II)-dependent dioxygenase YbiX